MNESPWISIIIPVYNAGQYFEECLQTVCGNTQLDIEIILIDDGSTDGSGNTARKWAAKDVRVRYIQQENQGCSSARNHGIELARGKWIMFVDADDTIEPDTMKKLRVLEPKFEDAEIVCFGCHMNLPENMTELHRKCYNGRAGFISLWRKASGEWPSGDKLRQYVLETVPW